MINKRPTRQIYSNYTPQDVLVWKTLFNRQMASLKPVVSSDYLYALEAVNFKEDKIPDFREVNRLLKPLTGWTLEVVPNISPQKEFFECLSRKKFTATCWLRTFEQLDYLEEPDMFHDVFGHVPLLSNKEYVGFFKGISDIFLKYKHSEQVTELLGRMYWFTIEFGLIKEESALKIYGAGIISSKGETEHCLSDRAIRLPFDVETIFNTSFRTDVFQETYFVIESFEQLYNSLLAIESVLLKYLLVPS
ncbi:MAG: phenylalanine 4-monooxygenase [Bacteroidota bacterium]